MKDEDKTKAQLINELAEMRQRMTELEQVEARHKQLLEQLEKSEMAYYDLYYNAPDMFVSVDAATEKIMQCNKAVVTALGYAEEEIIGRHISQMYHPDSEEDRKKVFQSFVKTGEVRDAQLQLRRKDGGKIDVSLNVSSVRDEQGNVLYSRSVWRDITKRKQAEQALRESEGRFRQLAENIREIFWLQTPDASQILYISSTYEQIWGRTCQSLYERPTSWLDAVYPADQERVIAAFEKQKKGAFFDEEYRIVRPDESIRWIWARGFPVRDESGTVYRIAGIAEDITARKQAEELARVQQQQLVQADKMAALGILVSGVAHEINNPNNFIMLNAEVLTRTWNDVIPLLEKYYQACGNFTLGGVSYTRARETIGRLISGVSNGTERIQKIVATLKDFAYRDEGDLNEQVDSNAVVESAILIMNNLIKKSTACCSVELAENLPTVRGNPQQLEQVVINLINNSCQALSHLSQSLVVSTAYNRTSDRVIIQVRDGGEGIPPERLRHIMDPFFTTKRDVGGTGLGL
ncbi:MAG: PAS domain S-box protein, partial [Candidatus Poribacteria bacterium]|nr:PAS domain S-box protein [Candidatus Poribacteria bacterium]